MNLKKIGILCLGLMAGGLLQAKVRLASVFGSDMVLQRQCEAPLWGWAEPGAEVAATGSWDGSTVRTRCGAGDAEAENSRRGRTLYGYRFGRGGRYVGERADRRGVDLLGAVQYGDAGRRMGPRARLCPRDRKRRLASDTSVRRQAGFQFGSEGRCTGRRRRLAGRRRFPTSPPPVTFSPASCIRRSESLSE